MSNWTPPLKLIRRERGDWELRDGKDVLIVGGTEAQCRAKLAEFATAERRQRRDGALGRAIGAGTP
jgi:hypothetical protein